MPRNFRGIEYRDPDAARRLVIRYRDDGASIQELTGEFDLSFAAIRNTLIRLQVPLRGRGWVKGRTRAARDE